VLTLEYNRDLFATLCLGRHEDAPPISDEQIEQLRILAPHLRRAVTIGRLLDATASAAASFEAALDASASGVILVGPDMNVVYANERANLMLRAGDPVATLGGRLRLRREVVPGQLESAVRSAGNEDQMGRRGMGIPARRGDGSAVVVHVMPLERRAGHPGSDLHASAAVFLAEASEEPNLPMEALTLLYGLRPAEARVFELIVAGRSSREIASALSVAPNTLKTHTQRLFDKLGRHRRADLVQLASELSFPH
jgi:DNA-binding CsgD family transcriptional regulator